MEQWGIVIGSFGTSYEETRKKNIDSLEDEIRRVYPQSEIVQGYTSGIIRGILAERGTPVFSIPEALEELKKRGVTKAVVQATHLLTGSEYEKLRAQVEEFSQEFERLEIGLPLLAEERDIEEIVEVLNKEFPFKEDYALVLMGHGSAHKANNIYEKFSEIAQEKGYHQLLMGTVEAHPTILDILEELQEKGIKRVTLTPFMLVAGDHATKDMASTEKNSWYTLLTQGGYEVEVLLKGLGEYPAIRQIYLNHLEEGIKGGL